MPLLSLPTKWYKRRKAGLSQLLLLQRRRRLHLSSCIMEFFFDMSRSIGAATRLFPALVAATRRPDGVRCLTAFLTTAALSSPSLTPVRPPPVPH